MALRRANTHFGKYSTRFAADVIPYLSAGDVLVYSGSVNDGGQTAGAVQTQATADLTSLKAALPGVSILVTSPVYMTTPLASHPGGAIGDGRRRPLPSVCRSST